jgi:hypothetical protein
MARPVRGLVVRSKGGRHPGEYLWTVLGESGAAIRMDSTFRSSLQQAIQIKGWATEVEVKKHAHRMG